MLCPIPGCLGDAEILLLLLLALWGDGDVLEEVPEVLGDVGVADVHCVAGVHRGGRAARGGAAAGRRGARGR